MFTGAYTVKSPSKKKLFINVCRNIKAEQSSSLSNCGAQSSVCIESNSSQSGAKVVEGIGQPSSKLTFINQQIKLTYESSKKYSQCGNKPILTNIHFRCSNGDMVRIVCSIIKYSVYMYTVT